MEDIVVPFVFFGFVGFVVWVAISHRTRRANLRAEMQGKLLERFTSGEELAQFLDTDGGKKFLETTGEERNDSDPLGMLKGGFVVTSLGLGFLVLSGLYLDDFIIPAVILLALGVGLLTAATVTHRLRNRSKQAAGPGSDHESPGRLVD